MSRRPTRDNVRSCLMSFLWTMDATQSLHLDSNSGPITRGRNRTDGAERTRFRAIASRANDLAADRPDMHVLTVGGTAMVAGSGGMNTTSMTWSYCCFGPGPYVQCATSSKLLSISSDWCGGPQECKVRIERLYNTRCWIAPEHYETK